MSIDDGSPAELPKMTIGKTFFRHGSQPSTVRALNSFRIQIFFINREIMPAGVADQLHRLST